MSRVRHNAGARSAENKSSLSIGGIMNAYGALDRAALSRSSDGKVSGSIVPKNVERIIQASTAIAKC